MRQTATQDEARTFREVVDLFISACPGPPLAKHGLQLVAYQRVPGIPGLDYLPAVSSDSGETMEGERLSRGGYFSSVIGVANILECRPAYLSQSASRLGYSYSRALRWLRFCHGIAIRRAGTRSLESAWRTGFSDPSGWTRFTRALVGKSPSQLPKLPLEHWVWYAIQDVYLRRSSFGGSVEMTKRKEMVRKELV